MPIATTPMADQMKKEAYAMQQQQVQAENTPSPAAAPQSQQQTEHSAATPTASRTQQPVAQPAASKVGQTSQTSVQPAASTPPSKNTQHTSRASETTVQQTASASAPIQQPQSVRIAQSGYGDQGPILAHLRQSYQDPTPYLKGMENVDTQLAEAIEHYRQTGRNPLADIVLREQKPQRRADEEARLKQTAKLLALNNVLSLIGRGIAATGGIRPAPIDNQPIYDIQSRLRQLDDLYQQEGVRYDQNRLLAAIRKDQANLQAAQAAVAELQGRRKAYADLYGDALENNRRLAEKEADIAHEASKFRNEMAYKYDQLDETQRHNKTNEGIQWRKLQKEEEDSTPIIIDRTTRRPVKLTRENRAMLDMLVGYLVDGRTRDAKSGGFSITSSGLNYSPGGYAGRKPKVLNNMLTDEQWIALDKYTKDGTMTPTASAAYSKIMGAYSKALMGDMRDFGVPALPERPKTESLDSKNKKGTGQTDNDHQKFIDDAAYTVRGQMEVAELLGGGIPTVEDIKQTNANMDTKLTDEEWKTVYRKALDDFLMNKTGRDE